MRTLIDWLWYQYFKNTLIHISVLSIWTIKYPITMVLSLYFHVLEAWASHLLSYTCILKNVLKCISKHEIIQYYAMKSKIFFLLIIKVKNIYEFNVWNLTLWICSTQKKVILHWHTLICFHPKLCLNKLFAN